MTDLDAILATGGPWQRAERIGGQLLLQGDCREIMSVLPKVGAVVTDPPFGIKRDRGMGGGGSGFYPVRFLAEYQSEWDRDRPAPETITAMCSLADHAIIWGGQGTTLVACQRLGQQGIGIELDPGYFDIACERVRKEAAQARLDLLAPPPAPQQETLL